MSVVQSYSFPLPTTNRRLPEIPTDVSSSSVDICHSHEAVLVIHVTLAVWCVPLQHNLTYFYTNIHYNVLLHLFAK